MPINNSLARTDDSDLGWRPDKVNTQDDSDLGWTPDKPTKADDSDLGFTPSIQRPNNEKSLFDNLSDFSKKNPVEKVLDFSKAISPVIPSQYNPLEAMARIEQASPGAGKSLVKGAASFPLSLPTVAGALVQETGETYREGPTPQDMLSLGQRPWELPTVLKRATQAQLSKYSPYDEQIAEVGRKIIADNQKFLETHRIQPENGEFNKFMFDLGAGTSTLAGAIGVSVLTKNPNAAAVMFGAIQKGNLYKEARDAGKSPREASELSTVGGVIEGALEYAGLELLIKRFAEFAPFKRGVMSAGWEGIQELSQQFSENVISKLGWDRPGSVLQGTGESALIGVLLGGGAGMALSIAQKDGVIDHIQKTAGVSEEEATVLAESAINKQIPEIVKDIQGEFTEPTPVIPPVETPATGEVVEKPKEVKPTEVSPAVGKTIGIDAETGLPIIDRKQKVEAPKEAEIVQPEAKETEKPAEKPEPTIIPEPKQVPEAKPQFAEKPVKEIPAKKSLQVFPRKEQLLIQIQEAIEKAPDIKKPGEKASAKEKQAYLDALAKLPKITFQMDGGAEIFNAKAPLQEFYDRIKKQGATISTGGVTKTGFSSVSARREDWDVLYKLPNNPEWVTDGKVLIKSEKPKGAKFKEGEIESLKFILDFKGQDAKLLYYAVKTIGRDTGISDQPIAMGLTGAKIPIGNKPFVVFESGGKYTAYNQQRFNIINNRYPDATFKINQVGHLAAYQNGELVAILNPIILYLKQKEAIMDKPPLQEEAIEAGFLPEGKAGEKLPEPAEKTIPKEKTFGTKEYTVYQGEGTPIEEIYKGVAKPILGDANYYAFNENEAKQFGDVSKKEISLKNPLVINSDEQWKKIAKEAGWKYPNLTGLLEKETSDAIDTMKKLILEKGHDAVIIKLEETTDSTKTIENVFGISQVIDYTGLENVFSPPVKLSEKQLSKREQLELDTMVKEEQSRIDNAKKMLNAGKITKAQFDSLTKQSFDFLKSQKEKTPKLPPGAQASLGRPTIDTFEKIPSGVKEGTEQFKLFEEVQNLVHKYAERVGEKYVPRGAAGVFYRATENIFLKSLNNISVAVHEVTHYVDNKMQISKQLMRITGESKAGKPIYDYETKEDRKLLTEIYLDYYPGAQKTHKLSKRMTEGFATLVQKYIEQPSAITEKYPYLVNNFIKEGGNFYHPLTGGLIADSRKIIQKYQELDDLGKIGARTLSNDRRVDKESFLRFREKIITEVANNLYPIEKIETLAGVSRTAKAPSLWIRVYNNIASIINRNINTNKGYVTLVGNTFKKIHDFNWQTLINEAHDKGVTDRFGDWLIARRQHFSYLQLDQLEKEAKSAEEALQRLIGLEEEEPGLMSGRGSIKEEIEAVKKIIEKAKNLREILKKDNFDRKVCTNAYNQYKEEFQDMEKKFDALVRADLNMLHNQEVNLISDNSYQEMIENEGYATYKRDEYNDIVGEGGGITPQPRGSKKVSSLKQRTGSELTIINPLLASVKNHSEIMRKSLKQIVINKLGKLAPEFPEIFQQQPLTKVPQPNGAFQYPQERDPNIIMVRKGDKRIPYLVNADIKKVIDEVLGFHNIHWFEKFLVTSSRMFTKGTTGLYPLFAISNIIVDQVTGAAQTVNRYKPVYSQLKLLAESISDADSKNINYLKEYMMLGGDRQTFAKWMDMTPNEFFNAVSKETSGLKKIVNLINQGEDIISIPAQWSEIFTRATEYINSRKNGKHQLVALEDAGRVTAPFHHIGRLGGQTGRTLIKSIPYFNSSIQVLAQYSRTLHDPETRKRAAFVIAALTVAMVGGFASILAGATKKQKDLYNGIHPGELTGYTWFPSADGENLLKFRIPENMGVVGTLINMAIADRLLDTKYNTKEYIDAITAWMPDQLNIVDPQRVFFSWMPQLIRPAMEVFTGKRTYPKVIPLEGGYFEKMPPELRFRENTSKFAIFLGSKLGLSPIKIDHLVNGYLGRTTKFITGSPITNPLIKKMYFTSGRQLNRFYELREKNDQDYLAITKRLKEYTQEEKREIMVLHNRMKPVNELLSTYRKIQFSKKNTDRLDRLREKILDQIDSL